MIKTDFYTFRFCFNAGGFCVLVIRKTLNLSKVQLIDKIVVVGASKLSIDLLIETTQNKHSGSIS